MLEQTILNLEFWKYASIPIVAAIVGWSTNWVAIKMLFYPVEPVGKPPYWGWQGILPSKAAKMGVITTETTLSKLGSIEEVFASMEPKRIAQQMMESIDPRVEDYVEWIMLEENPTLWNALPGLVKTIVYTIIRQRLPQAIEEMMLDIGKKIEDMVDLKQVVVTQLEKDRRLVNRIFLECGAVEFRFIIVSGLYFGFLFGLVQMGIWYFYPAWWILPLFGIIVGYATNWIALRIIFQPLNPTRIGPFVVQGLFLKRQKEVAEIWCDIVTKEVITVRNIIANMLYGSKSAFTQEVIKKYMRTVVDQVVGIAKPVVQLTVGIQEYLKLQESATQKAIFITPPALEDPAFNKERAEVVKDLIRERMEALSPQEFQNLLRPAFQEDEMKLILLGAALGFIAGMAQLFLVFGGL
ncbi:MAG: hypothetical protein HUU32_17350 [Calditrichaceae bacterium]|nr:hypothetical protein [Calditrichia bacterium]NUQ43158.1 hypothetical protein [Calditrichaceae bacterium]